MLALAILSWLSLFSFLNRFVMLLLELRVNHKQPLYLVEGLNVGFNLGRGRSTGTIVRPFSGGAIGASPFENSVAGNASVLTGIFCYPRGKTLDVCRRQKHGSSLCGMPENMEEAPSVTQLIAIEPLTFVVPDFLLLRRR
ncbi:hypothetical protein P3S67_015154 [Capsicum chacoense]